MIEGENGSVATVAPVVGTNIMKERRPKVECYAGALRTTVHCRQNLVFYHFNVCPASHGDLVERSECTPPGFSPTDEALYRIRLSGRDEFLEDTSWSHTKHGPSLAGLLQRIEVSDEQETAVMQNDVGISPRLNARSRVLKRLFAVPHSFGIVYTIDLSRQLFIVPIEGEALFHHHFTFLLHETAAQQTTFSPRPLYCSSAASRDGRYVTQFLIHRSLHATITFVPPWAEPWQRRRSDVSSAQPAGHGRQERSNHPRKGIAWPFRMSS